MRDKSVRGRVYNRRFSGKQVLAIRGLDGKISSYAVAKMFKTERSVIRNIWKRITYKHIGG